MNTRYFYCWHLGNTQVRGFNGQKYALEAIPKLLEQTRLLGRSASAPSKVTLCLNEDTFSIIGAGLLGYKRNNQQQSKTQANPNKADFISYDQINYIYRLTGELDDIVVIFVVHSDKLANINLYKSKLFEKSIDNSTELYAFRFDSGDTARKLDKYLNEFRVNYKSHVKSYEPYQKPQRADVKSYELQKQQHIEQQRRYNNEPQKRQDEVPYRPRQTSKSKNEVKNYVVNNNIINYKKNEPRVNNSMTPYSIENSSSPRSPTISPPPMTAPPPPPLPPPSLLAQIPFKLEKSKPTVSTNQTPRLSLVSDDVTNELKQKFNANKPLLFPPKDYNTVMRSKGKLDEVDRRRSLNEQIVGRAAIERRPVHEEEYDQNLKTITENDDLESIDDDAVSAIKFYDEIVNNLTIKNSARNPNNNFYRYEPPPSSSSPIYNEVKHNPLRVMESSEFIQKNNKNLFKSRNIEKRPSQSSAVRESPRVLTNTSSVQSGFRSGELAKLGNYAPKWINKTSQSSNNHSNKQYDNVYRNKNVEYDMELLNDTLNHMDDSFNDDNHDNSKTSGFILKPNIFKILRAKTDDFNGRASNEKNKMPNRPGQKMYMNNANGHKYTSINSSSDVYY
jgi:hypothetical protein